MKGSKRQQLCLIIYVEIFKYMYEQLLNNVNMLKATTVFLSGIKWDFVFKKIFNALANRKKIRFCIVAKNKIMLSPAKKKNVALLNLSSQYIVFMEKCISVPHDRKNNFCFPSHEKKIF